VSDGHEIYWEVRGNPAGKPAVALHGGPGSGCPPWWAGFFDLDSYRVVLFDQRGCGRSRPHAGAPTVDLTDNTTQHLIADIERLREHLGIERWLVLGGSWGSVLGLAYAQAHPDRVTELVLFSVGAGTGGEVEWITRGVGRYFPAEWRRFRDGVPERERDGDLAAAYNRLLLDPDPAVHGKAARDWCAWESTHMGADPRYEDPVFRLCFARLVTHYWSHAHFLDDGQLMRDLDRLADIPGVLIHGRLDISGPLEGPWTIAQRWGELVAVEGEGHRGGREMRAQVVAATDRFARGAA
jgi:proline iminopeptidase